MSGGELWRLPFWRARYFFLAAFLLQITIFQTCVFAVSSIENANRDAQRIQQQNLQQQQNLEKELRKRKTPAVDRTEPSLPAAPIQVDDSRCLQIDHINLEGATLLLLVTIDRLLAPYQQKCLTLNQVNQLLHDITNEYFKRGYVTTRAYLKPQSLEDRDLTITVIEGRVEDINFVSPPQSPYRLETIFPGKTGGPLNLRSLEQGLDHLNRLQSNNVRMNLEPGSRPGDTRVLLENEGTGRTHLNFGINNSGQESTGELQAHVGFGLDNPFAVADYFSLLFARELDQNDAKKSQNISGSYEIPFGWHRLRLAARGFSYKSTVEGTGQTFESSGTSNQLSVNLIRLLHRNQKNKTSISLMVERKEEDNFLEDVKLDASSRTLAIVRLGVDFQHQLNRGALSLSLNAHRGFDGLGADTDSSLNPEAPRAQFDKLTADLNVYYAFPTDLLPLSYNLSGHGQYSNDLLFSTERLSLGGLYTVRGYKNDNLSGDRGGYLRNELALRFVTPRGFTPFITSIRPFAAFDWGAVEALNNPESGYQQLRGLAVGFSASGPHLSCQLGIARAIDAPTQLETEKSEIYFSLSLRN